MSSPGPDSPSADDGATRPSFPPDVARIVDANLNRSAEALRVVEDIARFHLELGGFAGELKGLRHELLSLFTPDTGSRAALLEARDIEGDCGSAIPSPDPPSEPWQGDRLGATTLRNFQRLKESLRTLEETARTVSPALAARLGSLRYRAYALEKGVSQICATTADSLRERLRASTLCLLFTRALCRASPDEVLGGALDGGVDVVQLREKGIVDRQLRMQATSLRETTARKGALLVVNDRADIAELVAADGVHLGQDDLAIADARRLLAPGRLVGVSTHSHEQAREALRRGADYIGVGPCFATTTKQAGPPLGADNVGEISREVEVPAFAIGGIHADNLDELVAAGVRRIAVSSAVLGATSGRVARDICEKLREALRA